MTITKQILTFLKNLEAPKNLPQDVEVLNPFRNSDTWKYVEDFYTQYYNNSELRVIVFGINPGRLGGGITGIPFTDPIRLEEKCGINNKFNKRPELSSTFIYEMIAAYGGPTAFYQKFYISAVSPLGYLMRGRNLNYYDIPGWKNIFTDYAIKMIKEQSAFIRNDIAVCIGQGQNLKFLEAINDQYQFFKKIITVPHPRWIMQYRLKRKQEFIEAYLNSLRLD
ncbi:MAG: uracil-DNA glycosylase family protein [Bacteroidota bacterium]